MTAVVQQGHGSTSRLNDPVPRPALTKQSSVVVSSRLRAIFARADRNGDGQLTRAELILRLRDDTELAQMLRLPASVGDGERGAFEAVFQAMDVDESKGVSAEEFDLYFS
jgi:Ca2+-binding EF-hand superfamily protein